MITEVKDLFGNFIRVGNEVIWSETSSTRTSYLCSGEVIAILLKPVNTEIYVKIKYCGDSLKYKNNKIGKTRKFIYPRNYYNLAIIK